MTDAAYQHILVEEQSGVLVLTVNEKEMAEYELCTAVGHELVEAITKADSRAAVIDLHNIEFIASVGIVPFLSAKRATSNRQGRLVLCHLSDFVHQVFTITRLLINPTSQHSPFEWAETREQAIDMLQT